MGGELGNETYIDVLLQSSALSSPNFTLIENDNFYTNLVWVSWCFWVFAGISVRSSRKKKARNFSYTFFLVVPYYCVRVSAFNFQARIRQSGGARASGNFIRSLTGPVRSLTGPVRTSSRKHMIRQQDELAMNTHGRTKYDSENKKKQERTTRKKSDTGKRTEGRQKRKKQRTKESERQAMEHTYI